MSESPGLLDRLTSPVKDLTWRLKRKSRRAKGIEEMPVGVIEQARLEELIRQDEEGVRVYQDGQTIQWLPVHDLSALLSQYSDKTVLEVPILGQQTQDTHPRVTKIGSEWKTNFVLQVGKRLPSAEMKRQEEKRWQKLVQLGWPVAVVHGTDPKTQETIVQEARHSIKNQVTFTDNLINAGDEYGDSILAYVFPANTLNSYPTMSGVKYSLDQVQAQKRGFVVPATASQQEAGVQYQIDLNRKLEYEYSQDLVDYLEACHIDFQQSGQTISVPLLQRLYTPQGAGIAELKPGETTPLGPRQTLVLSPYYLSPATIVSFKDGTSIKSFDPVMPIPLD